MFIPLIWTVERRVVLKDEELGAMLEGTTLACSHFTVRKEHGRIGRDPDELRDILRSGRGSNQRHPRYESRS